MKRVIDLDAGDAKAYFLKGSSYFNDDMPRYIRFDPIISEVASVLKDSDFYPFCKSKPDDLKGVNYSFISNKDGRFAWRPYELMHPAIYVSIVNTICTPENWGSIVGKIRAMLNNSVICCSIPLVSEDKNSDKATQVRNWWQAIEQQSICLSLEFSHLLHTDVTDCYGSLYTRSIGWALHGQDTAKKGKKSSSLVGEKIDALIRSGRYGQTNGICQGSVLMDFIAEIVLIYVDSLISERLSGVTDYKILRYRDDYRVFTKNDIAGEIIIKIISDCLREVGMKLGTGKTFKSSNVVGGSIKPDKIAGIELQDLGNANAKTLQKRLLRLHSFGLKYRNSGALRRLVGALHSDIVKQKEPPDDLWVQIAIAADIGMVSPRAFPAIAGILSHLVSLAAKEEKAAIWNSIYNKMAQIPHNGYLEIWLQRVTKPKSVGLEYLSKEPICKIVNGENVSMWNNDWISSKGLRNAVDPVKLIVNDAENETEVIAPSEVELFNINAWLY